CGAVERQRVRRTPTDVRDVSDASESSDAVEGMEVGSESGSGSEVSVDGGESGVGDASESARGRGRGRGGRAQQGTGRSMPRAGSTSTVDSPLEETSVSYYGAGSRSGEEEGSPSQPLDEELASPEEEPRGRGGRGRPSVVQGLEITSGRTPVRLGGA